MWSAFKLSRPQISIFHSPTSPPSTAALTLLRNALSSPYPPSTNSQPLSFDLEVIENRAPTPDQLRTISSYISSSSSSSSSSSTNPNTNSTSTTNPNSNHPSSTGPIPPEYFLSTHPSADSDTHPRTMGEVSKMVEKNVKAMKWPIVVDWTGGRVAVGDVEGVKRILEEVGRVERGGK